jgi:hypothetical protein
MKKALLLFFSVCFLLFDVDAQTQSESKNSILEASKGHGNNRSSGVFTYTLTTFNETYNELTGSISLNNGEIWDDPEYLVPIGFPFELNGNTITFLQMYGVGAALASPTAEQDVVGIVAPFETDLIDRGYNEDNQSESPISY